MKEPIIYQDSSAIIKRYVLEPGSETVRSIYLEAYSGDARVAYSIWNIGEVLGVLDRARRIGRLSEEAYSIARQRFLLETKRMIKLGILIPIPLKLKILKNSWIILEKHHIYIADALQIASASYINADKFVTGDKRLHEIATNEKLDSILLT